MRLAKNSDGGIAIALRTPAMREPLVVRGLRAGSTVDEVIETAMHSDEAEPRKRQQLVQETESGRFDVLYRNPAGRLKKLGRKSTIGDTHDDLVELEIHRYLEVGRMCDVGA